MQKRRKQLTSERRKGKWKGSQGWWAAHGVAYGPPSPRPWSCHHSRSWQSSGKCFRGLPADNHQIPSQTQSDATNSWGSTIDTALSSHAEKTRGEKEFRVKVQTKYVKSPKYKEPFGTQASGRGFKSYPGVCYHLGNQGRVLGMRVTPLHPKATAELQEVVERWRCIPERDSGSHGIGTQRPQCVSAWGAHLG